MPATAIVFETHATTVDTRRREHLDVPYPSGESWRQAVARAALPRRPAAPLASAILVIGHVATRWALDHFINGIPLENLVAEEFAWQEDWEYVLQVCP
jgi:2,3-bisphosphoglycerate-dependent phosphoglycerate mutase